MIEKMRDDGARLPEIVATGYAESRLLDVDRAFEQLQARLRRANRQGA